MSKYVNIGSDLTSLCVVVGRDIAARIRRAYLTDNDAYLAHALSLVKDDRDCTPDHYASAASRVRFWMDVNTNWRDRCNKLLPFTRVWIHCNLPESLYLPIDHKRKLGRRVMIDANGPRVVNLRHGANVVGRRNDGTRMVRLRVTVSADCIFTSPVLATRLGLVDVIQTLLEKGLLDVHASFPCSEGLHVSFICLCMQLQSVDKSVLRYLLSREDFDINAPWIQSQPHNKPVHLASCSSKADPEALQMLLDHPSCSADDVAESGRTPLHLLCRRTMDKRHAVSKMKILLAAGANPELQDASGRTPLDHLINRFRSARTDEDIDLAAELLVTLQKATVARIALQEPT